MFGVIHLPCFSKPATDLWGLDDGEGRGLVIDRIVERIVKALRVGVDRVGELA
jgi:hypothetical protein